jgi:hypothetical protein
MSVSHGASVVAFPGQNTPSAARVVEARTRFDPLARDPPHLTLVFRRIDV